jgi:SulP family sulfate permease
LDTPFNIFKKNSWYKRQYFKADLWAGLTVGVMLIPQGMAYAMIAGLPPIYGLYASTIPIIIYALFGSSRHLAVGPVALVSLLTAAGIGSFAEAGSASFIEMAILLAFMVGVLQLLFGLFKLGFLINFLSHPVISGFTSAAALIIGFSQIKHLFGTNFKIDGSFSGFFDQIPSFFGDINIFALLVGLVSIVIIVAAKKINKKLPGALIALILGILASVLLGLENKGVQVLGEVPSGLPSFSIPNLNFETIQNLLPIALTISLVSFMESIAVAMAIQSKKRNYKVNANRELVSLGLANLGGSFFASYPVTGGFSRTAVNDQAGAQSAIASLVSALLIILTLLFLTPLFEALPRSVLAAVIIVAVSGLVDYKEMKFLWKTNRQDLIMLVVTFIGTLILGVEMGIALGILISLGLLIFRTTRPHIAELGNVPGTHYYRNIHRFDGLKTRDDILIMRFDAQLYFANIRFFQEELQDRMDAKGEALELVVINAESINHLDSSAAHMLMEVVNDMKEKNIELYFSGVKGPVRDAFASSGLIEKLSDDHFFMSIQNALDAFEQKRKGLDSDHFKEYTLQNN